MVKGILFDLDGTLYHQLPVRFIMILLLLLNHLFRPRELGKIIKIIYEFRRSQEILRKHHPAQGNPIKQQLLLTAEKTEIPIHIICNVIDEWFYRRPNPYLFLFRRRGIKYFLRRLKKKGFVMGVYSDYPADKKLRALGIYDEFSAVISGDDPEIFGFKPNTNGFQIAAQRIGLAPSEILYVGDRNNVDGEGAVQAGMHAAIFKKKGKRYSDSPYLMINSFNQLQGYLKL